MKSKTKAKIVITFGIIAISVVIIILINAITKTNKPSIIENNYTFYNTGNIASEGMEPVNKEINLGDILQNVKNRVISELLPVKNEEADMLLNLEEYAGLEKRVAKCETQNEYTEIWLLKISKEPQSIDIFRMFNNRIEELKRKYAQNAEISAILNNEKNISMKQQNGIVIIIISNNVENIEKSIDENFKSEYAM